MSGSGRDQPKHAARRSDPDDRPAVSYLSGAVEVANAEPQSSHDLSDALAACAVAADLALEAFRRDEAQDLDAALDLLLEASAAALELRAEG